MLFFFIIEDDRARGQGGAVCKKFMRNLQWILLKDCDMLLRCKEARHMHDTLKLLYDRFYTPLPMEEAEQEIETCHQQLIERLEKPERKLILRIMDAQGLIAEERSVDSFLCGFKLAWELAYELNHFEMDRHPSPVEEAEMDA